jgi:hypothetical protein
MSRKHQGYQYRDTPTLKKLREEIDKSSADAIAGEMWEAVESMGDILLHQAWLKAFYPIKKIVDKYLPVDWY